MINRGCAPVRPDHVCVSSLAEDSGGLVIRTGCPTPLLVVRSPTRRPGQKVLSRFGGSHPFGDGLSLVVGRSNNRKMAGTAPHRRKKM